jgi:hypothetical protein
MVPFGEKNVQENRFISSEKTNQPGSARIKVEQDIAFLTGRISAMKSHPNPNNMLIEHYQSMLKSRESVLKWLLDGCDDETTGHSMAPDR